MYLTSFVYMGLLKRQPPPEVNPRRKQARTLGGRWADEGNRPPGVVCGTGVCPHVPHFVR